MLITFTSIFLVFHSTLTLVAQPSKLQTLTPKGYNDEISKSFGVLLLGMKEDEVRSTLNSTTRFKIYFSLSRTMTFCPIGLETNFVVQKNSYQILWVKSFINQYDSFIYTPVVLENGKLIGWGYRKLESHPATKGKYRYSTTNLHYLFESQNENPYLIY